MIQKRHKTIANSRRNRPKSKQRKSTEPDKVDSESSERTNESTPEKDKVKEDSDSKEQPIEEDIESLISSNKILVPNAKPTDPNHQSDGSKGRHARRKQRNILKVHNLSGIQKPGSQQRILEKNAKRIQKLGQVLTQKDKARSDNEEERTKEGIPILKNISLNEECTIETIPNKRPADINTLKNKWQMSESFTQVKKNLSELSKNKDHKKGSEVRYSNPVKRLETNPSISVRELFPGEEEMNLQCNIEFNNVKGVTPEGWEKCNTMIQYDVETKKLWNELQRPYGNQSSFLRHLILLEKYFRSGDLILSHNASPHAATYSDSVQSRLRAYDNVVTDAPRRPQGHPERPAQHPAAREGSVGLRPHRGRGRPPPRPPPRHADAAASASAAAPPKYEPAVVTPAKEKKDNAKKEETPKKPKTTSKPWRPTLMPITPENLAKIAREPTQVAVDGRTLPSLVQVMSSGKRYHITLQDYNKMCIMRREKLQQIQDGEKTKRQSTEENSVVTDIQPSNAQCAMLGNGGTVVQNVAADDKAQDKKEAADMAQIGTNAATILKNVGLKNITIAPIPQKTATVTSQTAAPAAVSSASLLVGSTLKLPALGPAVSIVSEAGPALPKIPRSLTVIPQGALGLAGLPGLAALPATEAPRP
ncbi:hypothetical protein HF086_005698 [Spodoptera exigua]|uniref:Uncharacterized protein n=1 Tax=Spodoptera exigua TaxID=7107 RepID=A0A922SQV2_SPOEX|nr:hypothetical protein HF086_005698 [Spodoptera exigua]